MQDAIHSGEPLRHRMTGPSSPSGPDVPEVKETTNLASKQIEQPGSERDELEEPGGTTANRRRFLRQVAIAGAGVAGLTLPSKGEAMASPPAEDIRGDYDMVQSLFTVKLSVNSQNGNAFSGVMTFQNRTTPISGTVTGVRPNGGISQPITVVFNWVLGDGTIQTHLGAAATVYGANVTKFLAGVFYHDGLGPYPWSAEAMIVG